MVPKQRSKPVHIPYNLCAGQCIHHGVQLVQFVAGSGMDMVDESSWMPRNVIVVLGPSVLSGTPSSLQDASVVASACWHSVECTCVPRRRNSST